MNHDCCHTNDGDSKQKNLNPIKKSKDFFSRIFKSVDPFIMIIVLVTIGFLTLAIFLGSNMGATPKIEADDSVSMQLENNTYDWGEIGLNDGNVTAVFPIKNEGTSPLQLYDIKTSCTCTTAQLVAGDKISKKFGMHEKNPGVFEIAPGETAEMLVEFNPAFHGPGGVGSVVRVVSMETNDPTQPEMKFQLTADVVSK
jgi:hypothetical protein